MCNANDETRPGQSDTPRTHPYEGPLPADYSKRSLSPDEKAIVASVERLCDERQKLLGLLELVADGHMRNLDDGYAVVELQADVMTEIYQATGLSPRVG